MTSYQAARGQSEIRTSAEWVAQPPSARARPEQVRTDAEWALLAKPSTARARPERTRRYAYHGDRAIDPNPPACR